MRLSWLDILLAPDQIGGDPVLEKRARRVRKLWREVGVPAAPDARNIERAGAALASLLRSSPGLKARLDDSLANELLERHPGEQGDAGVLMLNDYLRRTGAILQLQEEGGRFHRGVARSVLGDLLTTPMIDWLGGDQKIARCEFCLGGFIQRRSDARFCSTPCRSLFKSRGDPLKG